MILIKSSGRGRLPVCVVRNRSVLCFIAWSPFCGRNAPDLWAIIDPVRAAKLAVPPGQEDTAMRRLLEMFGGFRVGLVVILGDKSGLPIILSEK
jgi:hypothetical protein